MRNFGFAIFFLLLLGKLFACADISVVEQKAVDVSMLNLVENRVYIDADHVKVNESGIYVWVKEIQGSFAKVFVPQLNFDENGIFVLAENLLMPEILERCPKGHPLSCPRCFRCKVSSCPYRCRGH